MEHPEIRYRILFILYLRHYSSQLGRAQVTEKVIEEAGLEYVDRQMVLGDVVYLNQKYLVDGKYVVGQAYPYTLIITPAGIDLVDSMLSKLFTFLKDADRDSQIEYHKLNAMGQSTAQLQEIKGIIDKEPSRFSQFVNEIGWNY